jgi:hypothetical protein
LVVVPKNRFGSEEPFGGGSEENRLVVVDE